MLRKETGRTPHLDTPAPSSEEATEAVGQSLEARGVTVRFEGVVALDKVDLQLKRGEILGLIGPNGAGKTTMVNVLTGFQDVAEGSVWLNGQNVTRMPASARVRLGICRSFQSTRLFGGLPVSENIEVAGLGIGLTPKEASQQARALLESFDLETVSAVPAGSLPHGLQRRVSIVRALACRPMFLLLDEPAAGLDESESDQLVAFIRYTRERTGCGILVIEHDMRVVMSLCESLQVLDFGETIAVGKPQVVRTDPRVIAAYLGEEGAA
jgi:branched-chain amino acid transport system ATP-binding protein